VNKRNGHTVGKEAEGKETMGFGVRALERKNGEARKPFQGLYVNGSTGIYVRPVGRSTKAALFRR